jgi:transcriptional/translational regulatory protein YebC/TACO1
VLGYALDEPGGAEVFAGFAALEALQDGLRRQGLNVVSWDHRWVSLTACELEDGEQLALCLRLLDALEGLDDVRSVASNLEADASLLEGSLT